MLSLLILYRFADLGSRGTHGHDRDFSGAIRVT